MLDKIVNDVLAVFGQAGSTRRRKRTSTHRAAHAAPRRRTKTRPARRTTSRRRY